MENEQKSEAGMESEQKCEAGMESANDIEKSASEDNNNGPATYATPVVAYVPIQYASQLYSVETALNQGTLFPELDKPFLAYGAYRGGSNNAR